MSRTLTPSQKEAKKLRRRQWYAENKDSIQAYQRNYRREHREKVNATLAAWRDKNREKIRARGREHDRKRNFRRKLMSRHNITVQDYLTLLESQGGCCAICRIEGPRHGDGIIRLDVDHDHATGVVRGLLCNPCNTGMGHMRDSVENLRRAVRYLQKAQRRKSPPDPAKRDKAPKGGMRLNIGKTRNDSKRERG